MNPSESGSIAKNEWPVSDSRNCVNIIDDGPGDTTVRPASPARRKILEAERERIARWYREQNESTDPKEPTDPNDRPDGQS